MAAARTSVVGRRRHTAPCAPTSILTRQEERGPAMYEIPFPSRWPQFRRPLRKPIAVPGLALMAAAQFVVAAEASAQEAVESLPEVVVSASRVPVATREVGSALTVITAADIERKQVRLVSDVLREVPGLAVSRSGTVGTFTQVRIRGAEANQTLVIIDGVEVNDPSGGSEFNFGTLLAADIERIEILRGPQSALYGSDAIGGVINIITKTGRGPMTGRLALEGGSFRTGQAAASVRGGGARYRVSFGATGFATDGVSIAPESQGNTEDDGYRNQTYNAKVGVSPFDNLDIDLSGRYVKSRAQTDPQPAVAGLIKTRDGDNETETVQRTGRAQATYSLFDGAWEHIIGVGINQEKADSFTDGALTFEADGRKVRYDYQTNLFFETPEFAQAVHTLTFLAEREDESQVTRSAFGSSDLDITNYGFVGEYRIGLWERLFLSGSVRRDDNDIFEDATTYRATAAYLHDETATRLHGSFGTGVKNPTLFELFGFGPTFVPNPDLEPEKSKGWDIGIEQRFFDDRVFVDVTYFNNRITDLIQGAGNTAVNLTGTTRIQGLEISARATLATDLTFTGHYTYTDGEDANGTALVRRAKHLASAGLAYAFADGRARLDLGIDYNGRQKDIQFSNFFATRTTVTLDDFVLARLAGTYEFVDGVEIYGRIENLLDQDYEEVLGFSNPGLGAFVGIRATVPLL
ncbi:MAG: TonB-dependent receptor [Alphaproteobacteria bacterium]|nr:MAG: TonB-dependent receptor [Alphaproteobacteria bacterium]